MLNFFRKKETKIEFTDELLERLELIVTEANQVLIDSDNSDRTGWLSRILDSAKDRNTNRFKNLVLSNELLGGSGSIIDIAINDSQLRLRWQKHLVQLMTSLMKRDSNTEL